MTVRPSATPPAGLPLDPKKTPEVTKETQSKTLSSKEIQEGASKTATVVNSILSNIAVVSDDVLVDGRNRAETISTKKESIDAKQVSAVSAGVLSKKEEASDTKTAHAAAPAVQDSEITDTLVEQFLKGKDFINPADRERIEKLKAEYKKANKDERNKLALSFLSDLPVTESCLILEENLEVPPFSINYIVKPIFFKSPAILLNLLKNPKIDFAKYDISIDLTRDYLRLNQKNDFAYAACIREFKKYPKTHIDFGSSKNAIIQDDFPYSSALFLTDYITNVSRTGIIKKILECDGSTCFAQAYKLWAKELNWDEILKLATEAPAPKCLAFLLGQKKLDRPKVEQLEKTAKENGSIETVLALCENDYNKAADIAFAEIIPFLKNIKSNENQIKNLLSKSIPIFLRFSPVFTVDKLMDTFIEKYKVREPFIYDAYKNAKAHFLRISPFIARYTKAHELDDLHKVYTGKLAAKHKVEEDLVHGAFCRSQVETFVKEFAASKFKAPISKEFQSLPGSAKGTHRVAALLEQIGKIRSENQEKRGEFHTLFKELREEGYKTKVADRYIWAEPLIDSVRAFSKDPNFKFDSCDDFLEFSYQQAMPHKIKIYDGFYEFRHGRALIAETWPAIENLFEEIMGMDLKPSQSKQEHEKRLTDFYSKAAELMWLIGTTQPLKRGSGTVAEWLLGIIHLRHAMEPPTLKTHFPQLDVLDLTFPLNDYKLFFTYFFEPSTLPEHLRSIPYSNASLFKQMENLYREKYQLEAKSKA